MPANLPIFPNSGVLVRHTTVQECLGGPVRNCRNTCRHRLQWWELLCYTS